MGIGRCNAFKKTLRSAKDNMGENKREFQGTRNKIKEYYNVT